MTNLNTYTIEIIKESLILRYKQYRKTLELSELETFGALKEEYKLIAKKQWEIFCKGNETYLRRIGKEITVRKTPTNLDMTIIDFLQKQKKEYSKFDLFGIISTNSEYEDEEIEKAIYSIGECFPYIIGTTEKGKLFFIS